MSDARIMTCGCAASALLGNPGVPGCGVHDCTEVEPVQPSLTGRTATCAYGHHGARPSQPGLAFFKHRPSQPTDEYYCGCWGWD